MISGRYDNLHGDEDELTQELRKYAQDKEEHDAEYATVSIIETVQEAELCIQI